MVCKMTAVSVGMVVAGERKGASPLWEFLLISLLPVAHEVSTVELLDGVLGVLGE